LSARQINIYVFRDPLTTRTSNTVVAVAPYADVIACFGLDGLDGTFGGHAIFKNDESGDKYLGVWGARNASRFRTAMRRYHPSVVVIQDRPAARLSVLRKQR
jgi:hypothetical protein